MVCDNSFIFLTDRSLPVDETRLVETNCRDSFHSLGWSVPVNTEMVLCTVVKSGTCCNFSAIELNLPLFGESVVLTAGQ